jgi:elongation factor 1-alpha
MLALADAGTLRVAVVGNVDSGKSTLIGTLCHSALDDGKGSSRKLVTRSKHELETGRTSTITSHLMGFDEAGEPIRVPRVGTRYCESYLGESSARVVSLVDLAGHEKYFKTTTTGLAQGMLEYALVLVSASQPPTYMTIHHLNLCVMLNVPVIVVVTNMDSCPQDVMKSTMKRIQDVVRTATNGKRTYDLRTETDVDLVQNKLASLVPVVKVSCVSGENLGILKKILFVLPRRRFHENKISRPFECFVENMFNVQGVGTVLSGFVNAGDYKKGETVYIGPTKTGGFVKTVVKSIHVMQTNVDHVWAGHDANLAVSLSKEDRKQLARCRMFVFKEPVNPTREFVADVVLTKGDPVTMIKGKYQIQIHILHQRPTCRLIDFEAVGETTEDSKIVLRPGQMARAKFKLMGGAYYIRPGMRIVLRDGRVRGIGKIVG